MKKKALGRGLGAFLSGEQMDAASSDAVRTISVDDIQANPMQPRKHFDEEKIDELAASIKVHGVIQPIVCSRLGDSYVVVVGERRFRASKKAGLKTIPVIVREFSTVDALTVALIENIQRQDLNAIEEARAYSHLMKEHKLTQSQLAEQLGFSRSAVANTVRLLQLAPELQAEIESGGLTPGHARALMRLDSSDAQKAVFEKIKQENLSVRQTEELCKMLAEEKATKKQKTSSVKKKATSLSAELKQIQEHISHQLSANVAIRSGSQGSGKIELAYESEKELERLLELLIYLGDRIRS